MNIFSTNKYKYIQFRNDWYVAFHDTDNFIFQEQKRTMSHFKSVIIIIYKREQISRLIFVFMYWNSQLLVFSSKKKKKKKRKNEKN